MRGPVTSGNRTVTSKILNIPLIWATGGFLALRENAHTVAPPEHMPKLFNRANQDSAWTHSPTNFS